MKKVTERKLDEHSPGLLLNSSLTILANSVVDNIRTVVVHRLLKIELLFFASNQQSEDISRTPTPTIILPI